MKCISCEIEINPKWTHAIDINLCPFCGKGIMEEHLKNLFVSLRETMDRLKEYPDQLNDWMLSNHNYIKTNSPEIGVYAPKCNHQDVQKEIVNDVPQDKKDNTYKVTVETERGSEEVTVEKIQSEKETNEFFKRAEAIRPNIEGYKSATEKTQRLKELTQQIKREGATVINKAGMASQIPPEMMGDADPEALAEFEAIMSGDEVSSSLSSDSFGEDQIPSVVLNMANRAKGSKDNDGNEAKIMLQQQQSKLQGSKENFKSAKGSFSRS